MIPRPYQSYAAVCARGHGQALARELAAAPPGARKILFCAGDSSQCSFFRMYLPALALQRHAPGTYAVVAHWLNEELVGWADIIIIQRMHEPNLVNEVGKARKAGKIVIYDLDDNLHALDDTNPSRPIFDACRYFDGSAQVSDAYEMALYFMAMSNMLLFSTEPLREYYASLTARRARVIPNHIDTSANLLPLRHPSPAQTRIVWAGGTSHVPDLRILARPLAIIKKIYHEKVKIIFMGFDGRARQADGSYLDAGAQCDVFDPGVPIDQYHAHLAASTPHIGLAPIDMSLDFSRYKSPTKWIDYTRAGAATVATDCCVHSPVAVNGVNALLVDNTPSAWVNAMTELIENAPLRTAIAARAGQSLDALSLEHCAAAYQDLFAEAERFAPADHAALLAELKNPATISGKLSVTQ